jgi:hypothetical protein
VAPHLAPLDLAIFASVRLYEISIDDAMADGSRLLEPTTRSSLWPSCAIGRRDHLDANESATADEFMRGPGGGVTAGRSLPGGAAILFAEGRSGIVASIVSLRKGCTGARLITSLFTVLNSPDNMTWITGRIGPDNGAGGEAGDG